jgi:hypothetical protein
MEIFSAENSWPGSMRQPLHMQCNFVVYPFVDKLVRPWTSLWVKHVNDTLLMTLNFGLARTMPLFV